MPYTEIKQARGRLRLRIGSWKVSLKRLCHGINFQKYFVYFFYMSAKVFKDNWMSCGGKIELIGSDIKTLSNSKNPS